MKFNDILDCFNTAIEGERVIRDLHVNGHLVGITEIKKSMGPYRQSYIYINYVNRDTGENFRLITANLMDRVTVNQVDEFILKTEKQAIIKLIVTLQDRKVWDAIINGTFKDGTE
jgi:hypothetical protein